MFHDALNVAIAGDEEPVAIADRDEVRASLTSPDRIVDSLVDLGTTIQDRAGRLIMTMIESSGADEDMQRMAAEGEAANTANMRSVAEALDRFGLLRESVDVDRATDILVALCSPHVHHILRQSRGWSASDYRGWLTETINQTVVRANSRPNGDGNAQGRWTLIAGNSHSSWSKVLRASLAAKATIRAELSRTAAISARLTAMLASRVMINQPRSVTSGIQSRSRTFGDSIGQGGADVGARARQGSYTKQPSRFRLGEHFSIEHCGEGHGAASLTC